MFKPHMPLTVLLVCVSSEISVEWLIPNIVSLCLFFDWFIIKFTRTHHSFQDLCANLSTCTTKVNIFVCSCLLFSSIQIFPQWIMTIWHRLDARDPNMYNWVPTELFVWIWLYTKILMFYSSAEHLLISRDQLLNVD